MKPHILLLLAVVAASATSPAMKGLLNDTCSLVTSVPSAERCSYARASCETGDFHIGLINYLTLYYCGVLWLSLLLMGVVLLVCFVGLGLTASDHLCPNLYTISRFLKLSDNLAGLTLLALGNGAADVLSTYKAVNLGSANLALAELLGAAMFITTVVIGLMAVTKPFEVPRDSFLRDTGFFLVIILIIFFALCSGSISLLVSLLLVAVYAAYVAVVVSSHTIQKYRTRQQLRQYRARNNFTDSQRLSGIDAVYLDDFATLPSIDNLDQPAQEDSASLLHASHGSFGVRLLIRELSRHASGRIQLDDNFDRPLSAPVFLSPRLTDSEVPESQPAMKPAGQVYRSETSSGIEALWPELPETSSSLNRAYYIGTFPIALLLKLTAPRRDVETLEALDFEMKLLMNLSLVEHSNSTYDFDHDKSLLQVQSVLAVFFFSVTALAGNGLWYWKFPLAVIASVSSYLFVAFMYTLRRTTHQDYTRIRAVHYVYSVVGFMVSISWISLFATEIIAVLKAFSLIFNLSEAVLGVTVFALGNSVGDLISNLTIARMGLPLMAFGACFGGPLLALSSFGLCVFVVLNQSSHTTLQLNFSSVLTCLTIGLLMNIVLMVHLISKREWKLDRKAGFILIVNWFVVTIAATTLELL